MQEPKKNKIYFTMKFLLLHRIMGKNNEIFQTIQSFRYKQSEVNFL